MLPQLNRPTFQKPKPDEIYNFVYMTHNVDRIDLKMPDIIATYQQRAKHPNPYAHGHLLCIGTIFTLIDKDYFPVKDATQIKDKQKSDLALSWLKELHRQMLTPLTTSPHTVEDPNIVQRHLVGKYRLTPAGLSFTRAPDPYFLPAIMHNWANDLANLHIPLKDKAKQPFGLNQTQAKQLNDFAHYTNLFFSCVQPFATANNRLGRLVEAALRLQWRLPWRAINKAQYEQFVEELGDFQLKELPKINERAKTVK
jgi:hypothetical protein